MKAAMKMKIRAFREQAGLMQIQLADKLGVDVSTVCKWESGENRPSTDRLLQLAEFFHCPVDDLFDRTPPGQDGERR